MSSCFVSVSLQIEAISSADRSTSRLSNCIISAWGGPFWKHLIFFGWRFHAARWELLHVFGCFIFGLFCFPDAGIAAARECTELFYAYY